MQRKRERNKKIILAHREVEVKALLEVLAVYAILALVIMGFYYLDPTITGLIITNNLFNYNDSMANDANETLNTTNLAPLIPNQGINNQKIFYQN